jgi:membrane protein
MDRLTTLPILGPAARWFLATRVWQVYLHLDAHKWTRLAAAVTFTSFVALFPMLALSAAVGAALLPPDRTDAVQDAITEQIPGIADRLDLRVLVDNAGTVGVIAGLLLLVTGVGWASTLRETLRAMWDLEEDPGNPVLLRLKDLSVLVGLCLAGLVSLAGSTFAVRVVGALAEQAGLAGGGAGTVLLRVAGYAAAAGTDFLLLWYVLRLLPRVHPPRRALVTACLIGAVGFELLKLLLGGYLAGVASKSMYGAFGVPVALLLWINFMAKLLLFCASWTATSSEGEVEDAEEAAPGDGPEDGPGGERAGEVSSGRGDGGRTPAAASGGAPRTPPESAGPARRR